MRHLVSSSEGSAGVYTLQSRPPSAPPAPQSRRRRPPARAVADASRSWSSNAIVARRALRRDRRGHGRQARRATWSAFVRNHPYLELEPRGMPRILDRAHARPHGPARERSLRGRPAAHGGVRARPPRAGDAQEAASSRPSATCRSHRWGFVPRDPWSVTLRDELLPARRLDAPARQHAVPVDHRALRRGPAGATRASPPSTWRRGSPGTPPTGCASRAPTSRSSAPRAPSRG